MDDQDAHVFPDFLTLVLTQLSFENHRLLFSHATEKVRLNQVSNSQPPGHEFNTLTSKPLILASLNFCGVLKN